MTNSLLLKMAIEIVDVPINSMVIFHSYVSLPEGINMVSLCMGHHWLLLMLTVDVFLFWIMIFKNNLLLAILKHFQIFQAAMVALIQGQNTLAKYFKANCLCSKRFA